MIRQENTLKLADFNICHNSRAEAKQMGAKQQAEELIQAIKGGKTAIVSKLLNNGCDPNCRSYNKLMFTPAVIVAVTAKNFESLKLLLKYGADVDARDTEGMTAALFAADMGLLNCLNILVENNANVNSVNSHGANMLILAAKWDQFDCVQYLIEHISDVDKVDNYGKTALIYAAIHDSRESLNHLIDAGANLNIVDHMTGYTALLYALQHSMTECATILLNKKAEVNVKGNDDITALTLAFHNSKDYGDYIMIEKLLHLGADVSFSKLDQDYLHEMIARGKKTIVRLMVINGCPPFNRICKEHFFRFSEHKIPISPLCVALLSGHYDIAKYFFVNRFFTSYDTTTLPNDSGIRQKLQDRGTEGSEALAILNIICSSPLPLKHLSFIAISEVVSKGTSGAERKCKIANSGLPKQLQEELLYKVWMSKICLLSWHELRLEEDQIIEKCNSCTECSGEGYRVKKQLRG